MASEYVTLLANPSKRRRRRRRNPDAIATLTRSLPRADELLGAVGGATVALQAPVIVTPNATPWVNVGVSLAGTIAAAFIVRMVGLGNRVAGMAGLGGGLVTVFKATHILSNGAFGIPPSTVVIPAPAAGAVGRAGVRGTPRAALAAPSTSSISHSGVGAFRESEFARPPGTIAESLLV